MSYKTDLENNNQRLENNNQDIDNIIQQVTNIPTFSDTTATEEDVLVNKTYYSNGIKRTGTMNNIGQQIITPSTEKQMITKGYHDGTGYTEAVDHTIDENILPENIKQGVSILNIVGTLEEGINTSDATAIVQDIVYDKTAYVNGNRIVGSMEELQDITATQLNSSTWVGRGTGFISIKSNLPIINTINYINRYNNINVTTTVTNMALASGILLNANVLKSGVTLLDINGTYTSDANALAEDIVLGKTAYVNGEKLVGTKKDEFIVQDGMKFAYSSLVFNNGSGWNTSNVTIMSNMFTSCQNLSTLDVSNWNVSKVDTMSYMFYNCYNLTNLDVSNWNTSNVTNMSNMFSYCQNLTNIDVSNWNTSKVTKMHSTFYNCSNLTNIDVSNWNVSKVDTMLYMFYNCSNLTNIDVSNWNTSNVRDMSGMFQQCRLTNINVSNWNTSNVTNMYGMFEGCSNLVNMDVSNWDVKKVKSVNLMFSFCSNLSNESIDSIINMCLNATNISRKNLSITNYGSPFFSTGITNDRYQNRWAELDAAGWTY